MNLIFFFIVFLPELGWYVYGNTFIYSEHIKECRKAEPAAKKLWLFSLKVILFGYIVLAIALGTFIFLIGAYFVFKSWSAGEEQENKTSRTENFVQLT